jgi:hypothetical protein
MGFKNWYNSQEPLVKAAVVTGIITCTGGVLAAIVAGGVAIFDAELNAHNSPSASSSSITPSATSSTKARSDSSASPGTTAPSVVTIRFPPNNAHMPNNTFGASGIAKNVPSGDSLWLVIKPSGYHRWYPVSPVGITANAWSLPEDKICPAGGWQNIEVFLVPNIVKSPLVSYVAHRSSQHDPGIISMPTLATRKAASHVDVKFSSSKYC